MAAWWLTEQRHTPAQRIYSFDQQTSLNSIREVSATANDSAAAMDMQLAQVLPTSCFAAYV